MPVEVVQLKPSVLSMFEELVTNDARKFFFFFRRGVTKKQAGGWDETALPSETRQTDITFFFPQSFLLIVFLQSSTPFSLKKQKVRRKL